MEPTNVLFYLQPHTIRNNPLAFEWIFLNYLKVARGLAGKKVACSFLVDDQIKARYQDLPCQIISPSDYGVVFDTSHWPEYWHEILTNPRHEQKSRLLEQVFQEHTYHYVFCWNYDAVLDRVCKEKGCRVIYQELGMTRKPLLYQMDFEGLLWKSSLQRLYGKLKDQVSYDPARLDSFLRIMKNKPLRPRQEIIRDLQLDEKKPILLIPLQVEDDSNIVVGSPFKCMDDFIRFCLGGIRDIEEYNVIIKKHPVQADFALDPALSRKDIWQRQVRVLLNEIDNMSLIKAADTIVTINSSAGFEGLCFGKKVMTLGKSPYSHLGVTADLDSQRQFALADHEPFFTSLYRQDSLLVPRFLHFAIFHYQIPSYQVFSEEYYLDLFRQLAVEKDVDTVYLRRQEQQPAVCDSALYHAEIEIEELREESRLRTEYMQKLEREIARKEMDVQNVKNELQHRSNKLEERNSYIGKLEADLQKVLHDLSVIIQARAFKIVSKYYLFRNRILPFGSRRRKFVKFFLVDMLRLLKRVLHEGKNGWKQFWINWQTTVPVEDPQLLSLDLLLRRKSSEYERARLTGADSSSLLKNLEYAAQIRLQVFLSSEQTLEFPVHPVPLISIIIILYNRVAASFQCLESILAYADVPYEIILVDNASADETAQWLDQLRNLQVVRNANNEGFLKACNQAAALAKGKYFLFLNNDTQISPKLLSTMFATLENDASIGLVGGRLIFPDGRMQEAGSIIWKDGSCLGYGREANPYQPEFNFFRDVDYCSGALVMTPKTLFNRLGTFDERYAPAYYEEADYCMQIRAAGLRVVYQPLAYVFHHEFGSATKDWAVQMQKTNQKKFVQKWGKHLSEHWDPVGENILPAREGVRARANILFIDDRIPNPMLGSGYPRAFDMLMMLRELGYRVTFWPLQVAQKEIGFTRKLQEKGVEVFYGPENTKLDLQKHLAERRGFYQVVLISRPHNMAEAAAIIRAEDPDLRLIYDAEAIFALREILFSEVIQGKPLSDKAKLSKITKEMKLAKPADCVLTVSEYERTQFEKHAIPRARVLGFLLKADPTPALYAERRDLLFVGGILASPSPNEDAVLYFLNEIFPHIQKQNACKVTIAGTNKSREIWQRHSESVRITGQVEDLYAYYNAHRVFVVPTRYAAGIPLKLFEAASHGIPAVVTPLIARQVGWKDGQDYLVGHNAGEFAEHVLRLYADGQLFNTLRRNALLRVEQECSRQVFRRQMQEAVEGVLLPPGKDGALPG